MSFGDGVRAQRKQMGLSQAELARRVGISQAAMGKIETGAIKSTGAAARIAAVLNTTIEDLGGSVSASAQVVSPQGGERDRSAMVQPRIEFVGTDQARIMVDSVVSRAAALEVMRILAG